MAALIRTTRVPAWIWCLTTRRPRFMQTVASSLQGTATRNNPSVLHNVSRNFRPCVQMFSAGAAEPAVERQYDGATIDRMIITMDRNVRRFARLGLHEVQQVLTEMERVGRITDSQSLLLIRCMGTTLAELKPEDRTVMVDQMWERMKSLGATYSIQHYNALLRVYLQNEHNVSPTDFLARLESNDIIPNRVTYQRLIALYCQSGDIKGASQILEHMKSNQLPVNEHVFNSIITGHLRADEIENADGVLDIMRQAGVDPSADTYGAFLNGFAEKGDLEAVKQTVAKAAEKGITLTPNILFRALLKMAKTATMTEAKEFLSTIPKLPGFSIEAMCCSLQLVCQGNDDLAYEVFDAIGKPVVYERDEASLGRYLTRGLVRAQRSPEKLASILEKMRADGYNNDTVALTVQFAYLNKQTDYALEIIEYMKKEGIPVRVHYFWPAICQYRDAGDKEKLKNLVKIMTSLTDGSDDLFQTLDDFIFPAVSRLGVADEDIVAELQDLGYKLDNLNFAYMLHILKKGEITKALEFGEANKVTVFYGAIRQILMSLYKQTKDLQSVLNVLKFVKEKGHLKGLGTEINGSFLMEFVQVKRDLIETIVLKMEEMKLTIPKQDVEEVKSYLSGSEDQVSTEVIDALERIGSESVKKSEPRGQFVQLQNLSRAKLEEMLQLNPADRAIQKFLLVKYCQEGRIKEVDELKTKMESTGFIFNDFLLRQLGYLEAAHRKDLQAASSYLQQLTSQYPDYGDYAKVLLNAAALQIEAGKAEEALAAVSDYCVKHTSTISDRNYSTSYFLENDCIQIIEAAIKAREMDVTKAFIELFFEKGLVKSGTANILRPYVEGFISNDDIDGALEALNWMMSAYGKCPAIHTLLKTLVNKEDPDRLQKVVDMLNPHLGEMSVLHQLMVAFIECGHMQKAKKIAETPGLRAVRPMLKSSCDLFVRRQQLKELEDLVSVTKSLFGVDRDEMLFQLIRYHANTKDWPKALNVLVDFEEEGIQPRARTLRYLAKALEGSGQPVPFEVPRAFITSESPQSVGQRSEKTQNKAEDSGSSSESDNETLSTGR